MSGSRASFIGLATRQQVLGGFWGKKSPVVGEAVAPGIKLPPILAPLNRALFDTDPLTSI